MDDSRKKNSSGHEERRPATPIEPYSDGVLTIEDIMSGGALQSDSTDAVLTDAGAVADGARTDNDSGSPDAGAGRDDISGISIVFYSRGDVGGKARTATRTTDDAKRKT